MTTTTQKPGTPGTGGWFKSSRSGAAGECVEINFDQPGGLVRIRDSKDCGEGPTISVTGEQWAIMLAEFAGSVPAGSNDAVTVETSRSGTTLLRAISDGTTLRFTKAEWRAFLAGVRVREFDYPVPTQGSVPVRLRRSERMPSGHRAATPASIRHRGQLAR